MIQLLICTYNAIAVQEINAMESSIEHQALEKRCWYAAILTLKGTESNNDNTEKLVSLLLLKTLSSWTIILLGMIRTNEHRKQNIVDFSSVYRRVAHHVFRCYERYVH